MTCSLPPDDASRDTGRDPHTGVQLTGHDYDGIQEYDNPMPGWWLMIFNLSIVFSVIYLVLVFMSAGAYTPHGQYARAVEADLAANGVGGFGEDAATLIKLAGIPTWQQAGGSLYLMHCASCHGRAGEGISGPNLTDEKYTHVEKITDLLDVIRKGRANGAMPAWENRLSANDIVLITSFVASLRGKNAPGGMWPERPGDRDIPPWTAD